MATVRTNLVPNPRYIGVDGVGGGGGGFWPQEDVATGGPDGGGWTRITATTDQTANVDVGGDAAATAQVTAGQPYTVLTHVLGEQALYSVFVYLQWQDATGGNFSTTNGASVLDPAVGAWSPLPVQGIAPDGATQVQVRVRMRYSIDQHLLAGDAFGVACRIIEVGDQPLTTKRYFDGDYTDTKHAVYAWTGEANASPSTETYTGPPSITASVLTREVPVAQVVVTNLPAGATYEIIGTAAGYTWPIPGGVGVADGEQLELVDTRAPFNVPVTYQLTYDDAGYDDSNTITLPLTTGADVVLATIDGALEAVPASLGAGDFPRAVVPRSKVYEVPGRPRGPVRWAPAGRAGSTWVLHCDIWQSADLDRLLATGRPLVYRLATPVRDLAPTDLIVVTEVDSVSFPDEDAWRTWTISFEYIDDPEPSTRPVVTSWDQFDVIYADETWDAFDAQWANQTWDDFDAFDWGQLQ